VDRNFNNKQNTIIVPVLDLFAGPGGLGEGFSSIRPAKSRLGFKLVVSVEKDPVAHQTLRIRSFFRQFQQPPKDYYSFLKKDISLDELFKRYPKEAEASEHEAICMELGGKKTDHHQTLEIFRSAIGTSDPWVLIGGPPCQAYSLAGRARNRSMKKYIPEEDHRHYLYREYLRVISDLWPAVFVMENVEGLATATLSNQRILERILADLREPAQALSTTHRNHRYKIYPFRTTGETLALSEIYDSNDYVVDMSRFGVPQKRHRILLLGIRDDIQAVPKTLQERDEVVPAWQVLADLPRLRSGLSKGKDDYRAWLSAIKTIKNTQWFRDIDRYGGKGLHKKLLATISNMSAPANDRGGEVVRKTKSPVNMPDHLKSWLPDRHMDFVCNHSTRGHIVSDLHRYMYASTFAKVNGRSPTLADFPPALYPNHKNVKAAIEGGTFSDRFRVQGYRNAPATTVTCHISKDGHYYIHRDAAQCRSLTVREAARVQTFPDNYYFAGPRTAQYVQVGNAVPPYLAHQLAEIVQTLLIDHINASHNHGSTLKPTP